MDTNPDNINGDQNKAQPDSHDKANTATPQLDANPKRKVTLLRIFISILVGFLLGNVVATLSGIITLKAQNGGSLFDALSSILVSILVGILMCTGVILYSIFSIKKPKIAKWTFIAPFIIVVVVILSRVLVVQSDAREHAAFEAAQPALIRSVYKQTADKDIAILFADTYNSKLFYESSEPNTGLSTNEVNTLYCYSVPNSDSASIVPDLTRGLDNIPVYHGPITLTNSSTSPSQTTSSTTVSTTTSSTNDNTSSLQNQFASANKINMAFAISGNSGSNYNNGKSDYSGIQALKTSNPNYYPQANIDIKINMPLANISKCSLPMSVTQSNLLVSVDFDLADDPYQPPNF